MIVNYHYGVFSGWTAQGSLGWGTTILQSVVRKLAHYFVWLNFCGLNPMEEDLI